MSELTIIETGEVVETMTRVEAERVTARIADLLDGIADNVELVMPLMRDAMTRKAWDALDYTSPTEYLRDRFTGALTRLPVELRRSVVTELSASGMSTRAIAPVVGIDQRNVSRDLQQVRQSASPERAEGTDTTDTHTRTFTDSPGKVQPITGPATKDWGLPKSDKIIGTDGKTYARPEPKEAPKPRAEAVTSQFSGAIADLNRLLDRFHRITTSPNYPANKNQVATLHGSDLTRAISELKTIADALN